MARSYDLSHWRWAYWSLHNQWQWLEATIYMYHTGGEGTDHYTTNDSGSKLRSITLEVSVLIITPPMTVARSYDLSHWRWAYWSLHHQWQWLEATIYHTGGERTDHYTTNDSGSKLRSITLEVSVLIITPPMTVARSYDLSHWRWAYWSLHHQWQWLEATIYHTGGERTDHYTTNDSGSKLRSITLDVGVLIITPPMTVARSYDLSHWKWAYWSLHHQWQWLEATIYHTGGERTDNYTTNDSGSKLRSITLEVRYWSLHHQWQWLEATIYHTGGERTDHYTTNDSGSKLRSITLDVSVLIITPPMTVARSYDLSHWRWVYWSLHHQWQWLEATIYHTGGEGTDHYTTNDRGSKLRSITLEVSVLIITPPMTVARSYDLSHWRWAYWSLHHQWQWLEATIYHTGGEVLIITPSMTVARSYDLSHWRWAYWSLHHQWQWLEATIYHTGGERTDHYTTNDSGSKLRSITLEVSVLIITPPMTVARSYDLSHWRWGYWSLHHQWQWLEATIYHTGSERTDHYTTNDSGSKLRSITLEVSVLIITPPMTVARSYDLSHWRWAYWSLHHQWQWLEATIYYTGSERTDHYTTNDSGSKLRSITLEVSVLIITPPMTVARSYDLSHWRWGYWSLHHQWQWLEATIYHTGCERTDHYTTNDSGSKLRSITLDVSVLIITPPMTVARSYDLSHWRWAYW